MGNSERLNQFKTAREELKKFYEHTDREFGGIANYSQRVDKEDDLLHKLCEKSSYAYDADRYARRQTEDVASSCYSSSQRHRLYFLQRASVSSAYFDMLEALVS